MSVMVPHLAIPLASHSWGACSQNAVCMSSDQASAPKHIQKPLTYNMFYTYLYIYFTHVIQ